MILQDSGRRDTPESQTVLMHAPSSLIGTKRPLRVPSKHIASGTRCCRLGMYVSAVCWISFQRLEADKPHFRNHSSVQTWHVCLHCFPTLVCSFPNINLGSNLCARMAIYLICAVLCLVAFTRPSRARQKFLGAASKDEIALSRLGGDFPVSGCAFLDPGTAVLDL